jgi:hypothetical protein
MKTKTIDGETVESEITGGAGHIWASHRLAFLFEAVLAVK